MTNPSEKLSLYESIKLKFVLIKFCIRVGKRTYEQVIRALNDENGDGTLSIDNGENMLIIHKGEVTIKDLTNE